MRIKSSTQNIIILLIKMNEYAEHERAAAVVAVEERASLAEGTHHRYSSSSFNVFSINNLIWNAILIFHPAKRSTRSTVIITSIVVIQIRDYYHFFQTLTDDAYYYCLTKPLFWFYGDQSQLIKMKSMTKILVCNISSCIR
jgi:hypothetical protein